MTEPKDYNIDEILIDLAYKSNHLSGRYEFEESILHKGTHLSNAKDQLYQLILEVIIGEDEPVSLIYERSPKIKQQRVSNPVGIARNRLRQEQRQKALDLFNIKENKK